MKCQDVRGMEDHAVIWKNGLVYDPHPSGVGLAEDPDTFTVFVPIDPNQQFQTDHPKEQALNCTLSIRSKTNG